MKVVKKVLVAVFWTMIFFAIFIPESTAFWNPNI